MSPATLAYILAGLKILDEIIRLIPDRILAAHTTAQAVTNAIKVLAAWAVKPAAGAALLLALASVSGCATYTSTQTRACVTASVEAARADIAAIRQCIAAAAPTDQCIGASADAVLADAEAALACVPVAPAKTP